MMISYLFNLAFGVLVAAAKVSSQKTVVSPVDATVSTISDIAFFRIQLEDMKDDLSLVTSEYENYTVAATMASGAFYDNITLEWDDELFRFDEIACTLLGLVGLGIAAAVILIVFRCVISQASKSATSSIDKDNKNLIVADDLSFATIEDATDDLSFVSCIEGDAMGHLVTEASKAKTSASEAPAPAPVPSSTKLSNSSSRPQQPLPKATKPVEEPDLSELFDRIRRDYSEATLPRSKPMYRVTQKKRFVPSSKPVAQALSQVPSTVAVPKPADDMGPYRDVDDESLATLESASECSEASYESNIEGIEELEQMLPMVFISFPKNEVASEEEEVQQAVVSPLSTAELVDPALEEKESSFEQENLPVNPFKNLTLKPTTKEEATSWGTPQLAKPVLVEQENLPLPVNPFKNLTLKPTTKEEATSWGIV